MALCAIIGDSIALGLAMASPGCDTNAVVGRSSYAISQQYIGGYHQWAVISAGSNDPYSNNLRSNLYKIRKKLQATKVIWVLPANPVAAAKVRIVAVVFGDPVVKFTPGKDGIHPKSYKTLARTVKTLI